MSTKLPRLPNFCRLHFTNKVEPLVLFRREKVLMPTMKFSWLDPRWDFVASEILQAHTWIYNDGMRQNLCFLMPFCCGTDPLFFLVLASNTRASLKLDSDTPSYDSSESRPGKRESVRVFPHYCSHCALKWIDGIQRWSVLTYREVSFSCFADCTHGGLKKKKKHLTNHTCIKSNLEPRGAGQKPCDGASSS